MGALTRLQASPLLRSLDTGSRYLGQAMRMMVGVPDYGQYLAHFRATHPDQEPLSYEDFFRNRHEARYGRGKAGCC